MPLRLLVHTLHPAQLAISLHRHLASAIRYTLGFCLAVSPQHSANLARTLTSLDRAPASMDDDDNHHISSTNFSQGPVVRVTVDIKSCRETIKINKGILVARSKFFRRELEAKEINGERLTARLYHVKAFALRKYITAIVENKLPLHETDQDASWWHLTLLYLLTEEIEDQVTRDLTLQAMINLYRQGHLPDVLEVNIVYRRTLEESPIRNLLVDMIARSGKPKYLSEMLDAKLLDDESKFEFVLDLSQKLLADANDRSSPTAKRDPNDLSFYVQSKQVNVEISNQDTA